MPERARDSEELLTKTTMRARLMATSMITGAAVLALSGAAYAADSTSATDAPVVAGAASHISASSTSGGIATIDAAADAGAAAPSTTVGEIVVTGSRIPQPNLTSVSPIVALGKQDFQLAGHTDVIDLLNTLPQNFQNNVSDFSNTSNPLFGPGGVSTADLRGLGPQRTLVLVNGRRLGIGDANTGNNSPAPDLDQIPVPMIDHVEVVTGGASATYGSDALAGVVNFVLKKDFEGLQIDGTLGIDQHSQHNGLVQGAIRNAISSGIVGPLQIPGDKWDGANQDASVIFGANAPDGKGNVTAYFQFHNAEPVKQGARDWSSCFLSASSAPKKGLGPIAGTQSCSGSTNSNRFTPRGAGPLTVVGNSLLPWPQAFTTPRGIFNSPPFEYLSRGDTRYVAGYEAHYDFSKELQLYSEFNFMDDRTTVQIAPSGLFRGGNPFDQFGDWQINCNNSFLSAQEATAIGCSGGDFAVIGNGTAASPEGALKEVQIGRRNIEGGPRQSYYEHFNYRVVGGVRGDILDDVWHYDVYGSYYYTFLYQNNSNYLSNSRIGNALDVVSVGGTPTCIGVLTKAAPTCVPYNILQTGGVTQAALNYLTLAGSESGTVEEQIVEGDITGDLGKYGWKTPWATDGIGVSAGADWRRDNLNFIPDAIIGSGDLGGGAGVGEPVNAGIGLWEIYGEGRIPIIQDGPYAKLLQLDGGVRYSDYSGSLNAKFTAVTYKAGLQWEPVEDFRLRASYQRATRAPSVIELFNPPTVTQASYSDPCAGPAPPAGCANTFDSRFTPAQVAGFLGTIEQCPAKQCDASEGGNPTLQPETADTWSVGATFRPHWVSGLSLSVDWWDIMEYNFITAISQSTVVSECVQTGDPFFCRDLHRSLATGALFGPSNLTTGGFVNSIDQNLAAGQTMGIDIQGDYRLDLEDVGVHGYGSVSFALNGTYTLKNSTTFPDVGTQDCAGLFGSECQTVNPRWRHNLRVTWNTPWNVLASLQWRYIGPVDLDSNQVSQPVLFNGLFDSFEAHLPAFNYLDLSAEWRVNTILTVRGGINNILDQDPPIVTQGVSGIGTPNTYPTYDLLGRQLFLSATARF
jgi:outer membrane receptor protein involved in Fe transport